MVLGRLDLLGVDGRLFLRTLYKRLPGECPEIPYRISPITRKKPRPHGQGLLCILRTLPQVGHVVVAVDYLGAYHGEQGSTCPRVQVVVLLQV